MSRATVTNQHGVYELELMPDGTVNVLSFESRPRGRFRGAGDVVAAATKAVGIKPCEPCRKRQEALNRLIPFGKENPGA